MLSALQEQLKNLWRQWTLQQRVLLSAAAALCLVVIGATVYWATRPDFVVMANGLSPQEAAEIVGLLETKKIEYELNFSGSAVSVSRSDMSQARLAMKDVWDPKIEDEGSSFGGFPGSPQEEEDQRTRKLERRVAMSIEKIKGIRTATVHISQSTSSPFVSEHSPTTASVILELSNTVPMSGHSAQSILTLVARAVEGLTPENISLMDTAGHQFQAANGMNGTMSAHFEHRQLVEHSLAAKAESMLAELLGPGKAVVRVSADIDFRETTRSETSYDPDSKVKKNETIETVSQTGGAPAINSEVGVSSNLIPDLSTTSGSGSTYKKEVNSVDFENASINETVRDNPGKIIRITVAAIVDLSKPVPANADPAADPAAATPAVAAIAKEDVEAIIKQAVGFDALRDDEVQVMFASLEPIALDPEISGLVSTWKQYEPVIDSAIWGTGVLLAAVLGFLALKRMTPVVVAQEESGGLTTEQLNQVIQLSEKVKQSPDVAAQILSVWMEEQQQDSKGANTSARKAA